VNFSGAEYVSKTVSRIDLLFAIVIPFLVLHLLFGQLNVITYVSWNRYFEYGLDALALDLVRDNFNRDLLFGLAVSLLLYLVVILFRRLPGGRVPLLPFVYGVQACILASRVPFYREWPLPPAKELFGLDLAVPIFLHIKYFKWMLLAVTSVFLVILVVLLVSKALAGTGRRQGRVAGLLSGLSRAGRSGTVVVLVAVLAVNAAAALVPHPAVPHPYNVIWVSWDSVRADHLSTYGYPRPTTPALDRFAEEAVVYEAAYAQHNWTRPSYASMFASKHVWEMPGWRRKPEPLTFPEILMNYGYRTFGYIQNANLYAELNFGQGFEVYLERNGELPPVEMGEHALRRIQEQSASGQPFFLFLHIMEPHFPYRHDNPYIPEFVAADVPLLSEDEIRRLMISHGAEWDHSAQDAEDKIRYMLDMYDATLRNTDDSLGQLVNLLKKNGLWENSLVIFNSDHGDEFHERGEFGHAHRNVYPELTAVPLLIHYPAGLGMAAGRFPAPVQQLDIYPTVLDVLGIPLPQPVSGHSLLAGDRQAQSADVAVSTFSGMMAIRTQEQSLVTDLDSDDAPQVFDRIADPLELSPVPDMSALVEQTPFRQGLSWYAEIHEQIVAAEGAEAGGQEGMSEELRQRLNALGYIQ
jgi:arylsulfatase A-like enzyme